MGAFSCARRRGGRHVQCMCSRGRAPRAVACWRPAYGLRPAVRHGEATTMSRNNSTWNSERLEALRRYCEAGLSCSLIAREIGVSRNAVIGKLNRLGLSRPKDVVARTLKREGRPHPPRPKMSATWRALPARPARPTIIAQHEMLKTAFGTRSPVEDIPIRDGRGCTLLELGQEKCRWPISTPGAADFCFCGSEPVKGLPYCAGHARMAYRPAGRVRSG